MQSNNCNRLFRLCIGACASIETFLRVQCFTATNVCIKYQYSADLLTFFGYTFRLTNHKHTEKLSITTHIIKTQNMLSCIEQFMIRGISKGEQDSPEKWQEIGKNFFKVG